MVTDKPDTLLIARAREHAFNGLRIEAGSFRELRGRRRTTSSIRTQLGQLVQPRLILGGQWLQAIKEQDFSLRSRADLAGPLREDLARVVAQLCRERTGHLQRRALNGRGKRLRRQDLLYGTEDIGGPRLHDLDRKGTATARVQVKLGSILKHGDDGRFVQAERRGDLFRFPPRGPCRFDFVQHTGLWARAGLEQAGELFAQLLATITTWRRGDPQHPSATNPSPRD